jgi:hypothetical protein
VAQRRRPRLPVTSGDINAVEATAGAVYIGGHLTSLCMVRNTSYTVRCPGALTVRNHVAALDPATGVPLAWNPGAGGTRGVLAAEALPAGLTSAATSRSPGGPPTAGSPCSQAPRSGSAHSPPGQQARRPRRGLPVGLVLAMMSR